MTNFVGEYNCKIDSKGRILIPSAFIKQMDKNSSEKFIIKKDLYEECLTLFPENEWEKQVSIIRKNTKPFNKEHRNFLRTFNKGTAELLLDGNNRLLIPKRLLDEIKATNEVILTGQFDKIEIWLKDTYDGTQIEDEHFSNLAEKILGDINIETDE